MLILSRLYSYTIVPFGIENGMDAAAAAFATDSSAKVSDVAAAVDLYVHSRNICCRRPIFTY